MTARDVHVYGIVPDREILTTWMVNSDLPSVCLADGTIIGNITPSELARYTPIGVACTTEIPDFIRLRHRVVDDTECRKLYALAYSGSRHD